MKQCELIKKLKACPDEKKDMLIKKLEESGSDYNVYSLSPEQERMAFLQLYTDYGKFSYICPYEFKTDSEEKMEKIAKAIKLVAKKREIFRALYFSLKGKIFQTFCSEEDVEIECVYLDKSELWMNDKDEYERFVSQLTERPFDLENELSLRICCVKKSKSEFSVYLIMHHINHDAWTIGLLLKDITEYLNNQNISEEKYSYLDYIKWKNSEKEIQKEQYQLDYWKDKLKDCSDKHGFKNLSSNLQSENGYVKEYYLEQDTDDMVREICNSENISPSDFFLSIFFVTLSELVNDNSVNIGTLTLNRSNALFFDTYGFFVNTVVLNCPFEDEMSFKDYLSKVSKNSLEALDNQDVSFDKVVDVVCDDRFSDDTPLINAMYGFYDKKLIGSDSVLKDYDFVNITQKKAVQQVLFLSVEQYTKSTGIGFIFNKDKLTIEWSNRFIDEYNRILNLVVNDYNILVSDLLDKEISRDFIEFENLYNFDNDINSIEADLDISNHIADLLNKTLGIQDVSYDESFFKIGCNSMNCIQLLEELNEYYSIELQIADIFRFSTVNSLSGYISVLKNNKNQDDEISFSEF